MYRLSKTNQKHHYLVVFASLIMLILFALAPWQKVAATKADFGDEKKNDKLAVLPIKIFNNRIHAPFILNGKPVQMLLDTGASVSVFFESDDLKADDFTFTQEVGVSFPAFRASTKGFRIPKVVLKSNGYSFQSTDFLFVHRKDDVTDKLGKNIDGILGRDFFEHQIVAVDPVAETVTLYKNGTKMAHNYRYRHALHMEGDTPYINHRSRLPWERQKTAKKLLLDTGYPGGIVFWDEKQFNQATNEQERRQMETQGKGVLYFGIIRFGRLIFRNIPIFISPDAPKKVDGRDGIIGATMFRPFRYAFDFKRGSLWLDPITKSSGIGYQIRNDVVYTPGNEKFVQKDFRYRACTSSKMTLTTSDSRVPTDDSSNGTLLGHC